MIFFLHNVTEFIILTKSDFVKVVYSLFSPVVIK